MKSFLCGLAICAVWLLVRVSNVQSELIRTLEATENFAEKMNRGAFTTVVKDITKTVSPYLNVISSVIRLIAGIGSASTQSAELEYLHKLSDSINQKFEEVNAEFSEVKNLIHWTAVQTSYADIEANIHVVFEQFKQIFEVPLSGIDQQKQLFLKSYNNNYHGSGSRLFAGFMHDHGAIGEGLLRPAMKYTENNRSQMRTFMIGILKLLLMAADIEIGFLVIEGYDNVIYFHCQQWEDRIQNMTKKMTAIDLELKNNYLAQAKNDIDKFSINNFGVSNQMFSQHLYLELSTKYYWLDWLVVVSTHTEGKHDAHSHVCNGTIKSTHRTKDLVIDSVDKDKPSIDINDVNTLFESLQQTCKNTVQYNRCHEYHGPHRRERRCGGYTSENADAIFNWFNSARISCSAYRYSSVGIIATNKNPVYYAAPIEGSSGRLFVNNLGLCPYNVHFFG